MSFGEPVQVPSLHVSVEPTRRSPPIDGALRAAGARGEMMMAAEVAWAEPDAFDAVTVHDTDWPASASSGVNAMVVARSTPPTRQTRPKVGAGVPFQTPSEHVSEEPAFAAPLIVGSERMAGAAPPPPPPPPPPGSGAACTVLPVESIVVPPPMLIAVTRQTSVAPTSATWTA